MIQVAASERETSLLPLLEVSTNLIEGEELVPVTGTPLSKVAVIDVASLITAESLSIPQNTTITSWSVVGKSAPVIEIVEELEIEAPVIDGEEASSCSQLQSSGAS